ADHGHDLAGQVVLVLPARRVELWPLEVLEAGPVGVLRHVEELDSAHEDVALVGCAVVEPEAPDVAILVPGGGLDGYPKAKVGSEAELVDGLLQILLQLGLAGVGAGPLMGLEGE